MSLSGIYIVIYIIFGLLFVVCLIISIVQIFFGWLFASPRKRFYNKIDKLCSSHYWNGSSQLEDARNKVIEYVEFHDGDYSKFADLFERTGMELEYDSDGKLVQQIGWSRDLYNRLEGVSAMFKKREKYAGVWYIK